MAPIKGSITIWKLLMRTRVMGCFRCDGCNAPSIAEDTGFIRDQDPLAWLDARSDPIWRPFPPTPPARPIVVKSFPDVPSEIAATAAEAYTCRMTAVPPAYRAAVLMARTVIEATAKDKGITKGTLAAKIDKLFEKQLIRPHVRVGAHEVRYLGNDMAHGDFVQPVNAEDADLVLALMSEVLEDVYQSPARVAKAQAKREERKAIEAIIATAKAEGKLPQSTTIPYPSPAILALLSVMYGNPPVLAKPDGEIAPPAQ